MNRGLLIGLAAVAGMSIYLSMQSDDELQVSNKQGARSSKPQAAGQHDEAPRDRSASHASSVSAKPGITSDSKDAWVSVALVSGVNQWQNRLAEVDDSKLAKLDRQAWVSMRPPPPPPPPKVVVEEAPPPPVAPIFPHQWIGRFNDDAQLPAEAASGASGANAPQPKLLQRAVVVGPSTTWVLKEGDVIEGQWRVDRIDNRTMNLTYLPLKLPQTVAMR
jgi:hypothetical protein